MPCHPLIARTQAIHDPIGPVTYDCVKLAVDRAGSANVLSEFGAKSVTVGDVILLGPNVLFGNDPHESMSATAVDVDTDFALDQFFWQHSAI